MKLKNDEQQLRFKQEDGTEMVFTYKTRKLLVKDLVNYFPNLFPHLRPLFKELLIKMIKFQIPPN
jgi:hypothetical protein